VWEGKLKRPRRELTCIQGRQNYNTGEILENQPDTPNLFCGQDASRSTRTAENRFKNSFYQWDHHLGLKKMCANWVSGNFRLKKITYYGLLVGHRAVNRPRSYVLIQGADEGEDKGSAFDERCHVRVTAQVKLVQCREWGGKGSDAGAGLCSALCVRSDIGRTS